MPANAKISDAMHFRSLRLENVRAFASSQCLEFVDEDGKPSRWNLILGENGVGKTTLLETLEIMRPIPGAPLTDQSADVGPPPYSRAELSVREDNEIRDFIRRDGTRTTKMDAVFETDTKKILEISAVIVGSESELNDVKFPDFDHELRSEGPFVMRYDAARNINTLTDDREREGKKSLLGDGIRLADAETILEMLDYKAKSSKDHMDEQRLERVKTAVARLLPGNLNVDDIEIQGPRIAGIGGVHLRTPSGMTPFQRLGLGYKVMFAWTVDLAWRLFERFPESVNPLSESAIVLIDEVDLHFHPRWQRDIRQRLLDQFPKVQFIATTHNPITAQQTISEGGNVAVVGWVGNEARILNNPIRRDNWRVDQLLVSELFGFETTRSLDAEARLEERLKLINIPNRTAAQDARLHELDEFVASLPTAPSPSAQSFEELMINLAKDLPRKDAQ